MTAPAANGGGIGGYDPTFFRKLEHVEDRHFWFRARRRAVGAVLRQVASKFPSGYKALELGCGNGGMLRLMQQSCVRGSVFGMDLFREALANTRLRVNAPLVQGDVRTPPFSESLHLVGMFDVLEHLDDDSAVLAHVRSMLVPGGALVLTVPAHMALWSYFDEAANHARRYAGPELRRRLRANGFVVEYQTQFMSAIYPLVWLGRRLNYHVNVGRNGRRPVDARNDGERFSHCALAERLARLEPFGRGSDDPPPPTDHPWNVDPGCRAADIAWQGYQPMLSFYEETRAASPRHMSGMFTRIIHRIVAQPWVYDLAQIVAGARTVRRRVASRAADFQGAKLVLDIGGGTGAVGKMWDSRTRYICLDIDPLKLKGFVASNPAGLALNGDATNLPLAAGSIDVVLCNSVTHHLTDDLLEKMLFETARVLKPDGKMILTDAVWAPRRWAGRVLWHYDRGSHPRPMETLKSLVASHLTIRSWEPFAVWHEYFICVAGRPTGMEQI